MWIKMPSQYELVVSWGEKLTPVRVVYDAELREVVIHAEHDYTASRITRGVTEIVYEFPPNCPIKWVAIRFKDGLWVLINS